MSQDFCNALLQSVNKNIDSSVQHDLATSLEHATKNDIHQILEIINFSHENQIQVKLISILTIYIMTNGTNKDIIVKFNPLYDKICEILTKGHQNKSNITLNFLTTLLHTDDEDACTRTRTLVLYAQNMIRASGCLMAMANLFTNGLLHQDTWQALCRCLADSCSGLESNQNYCSHLIPFCVRRCWPGNEHVFQVVQSLLRNNERNIQLFYKSGGSRMFDREFLKYDRCLQLLNTVVSNPDIRSKLLKDTDIVRDLKNLKQLYGSTSQLGQWVSIIFYTINLKGQVSDFVKTIQDNKHSLNNEGTNEHVIRDKTLHIPYANSLTSDQMEDTSELLKNIISEVLNFKQRKNPDVIKTPPSYTLNKAIDKNVNKCIEKAEDSMAIHERRHGTINNFPPVSFQLSNNSVKSLTNLNFFNDKESYNSDKTNCNNRNSILEKTDKIRNYVSHSCNKKENTQKIILDFKPKSASTPKHSTKMNRSSNLLRPRPIHKKYKKPFQTTNSSVHSKLKIDSKTKQDESVQSRIIGASRILDVINETCTTIMKSVTNMFRSKKTDDSAISQWENSKTESVHKTKCANSFTNYMRERDALLERDSSTSYWNDLMEVQYECHTCNDTLALKRKFSNDDFLKETVNKLKLGINLYGCNFKKIANTFWRDKNYMTPSVLYNLYRKLILK